MWNIINFDPKSVKTQNQAIQVYDRLGKTYEPDMIDKYFNAIKSIKYTRSDTFWYSLKIVYWFKLKIARHITIVTALVNDLRNGLILKPH